MGGTTPSTPATPPAADDSSLNVLVIGSGILKRPEGEKQDSVGFLTKMLSETESDATVDAILKGSGHQVYSMNVNIADTLTACVFALTLIPSLGIWGYVISIYATEILNTTLSLMKMISVSKIKPKIIHQVIMPIACIIGATQLSRLSLSLIGGSLDKALGLVLSIALTVGIYIALLLITKTISKDEFEFLNASLLSEKQYRQKFGQSATQALEIHQS